MNTHTHTHTHTHQITDMDVATVCTNLLFTYTSRMSGTTSSCREPSHQNIDSSSDHYQDGRVSGGQIHQTDQKVDSSNHYIDGRGSDGQIHPRMLLWDPTCGSGTMLWAGLEAGFTQVLGLDVNPTCLEGALRLSIYTVHVDVRQICFEADLSLL
jgi:hypothetical protein